MLIDPIFLQRLSHGECAVIVAGLPDLSHDDFLDYLDNFFNGNFLDHLNNFLDGNFLNHLCPRLKWCAEEPWLYLWQQGVFLIERTAASCMQHNLVSDFCIFIKQIHLNDFFHRNFFLERCDSERDKLPSGGACFAYALYVLSLQQIKAQAESWLLKACS